MNRITISVPGQLAAAVEREARRSGRSVSSIARDALSSHLHLVQDADSDRVLSFVGIGRSGDPELARKIDQLIAEEWTPDRDR